MFSDPVFSDPVAVIVRACLQRKLFFLCKQARGVLDKTEETEEAQVGTYQPASRKLLSVLALVDLY